MKKLLAIGALVLVALGGITYASDYANVGANLFATLSDGTKIPAVVGYTTDGSGALVTLGAAASAADSTNIGQSLFADITGIGKVPAIVIYTTDGAGVLTSITGSSGTTLADSSDVLNCSVTVTVASSALTISIKDAAGADPTANSPCKISFRNATTATGTYAQVSFTAAASIVISNGSALGCTASAQCVLYVYAINNAGTPVLGVRNGYILDEGSVQTSTALAGSGGDDLGNTLYTTATQTNKALRLLARVTITPAAAFAWTNAVTEISNLPAETVPWYVDAKIAGTNPDLGTANVLTTPVEIISAGLTMTPKAGSAPVGTMCSTTNAATAPSTSATTCAAGSESMGANFAIPSPGLYEVCMDYTWKTTMGQGAHNQVTFELIETPTNAQTLTLRGGHVVNSLRTEGSTAGSASEYNQMFYQCSIFNWTNKAAGTVVGVRLMYTTGPDATPTSSALQLDGEPTLNGRNAGITVKRL